MEPLPVPADPSSYDMLRDLSNFLGSVRNSDTSYSSVMSVKYTSMLGLHFGFELKRRDTSAVEGGGNPNNQKLSHTFICRRSALQVIRTLVACSTWTHGQFVFCHLELAGLDDLVLEIFYLLRSSRSLSTLEIELGPLYHRHLPTLLCENPFVETLTLSPGITPHPMDTEAIALCFSRNSVLKSCTLAVKFSLNFQQWEIALRPFTTSSKSKANVALKELVLQIHSYSGCQEAIANLVRCNTTLEKLEVRSFYSKFSFISLPKALAVNYTLKEFACVWSVAHLKELVDVFVPDSSGHQANFHLTTLKLFPTLECRVEDYMKELSRMLELNTTLKHVEIVPVGWIKSWIVGEDRYWKGPRHVILSLRDTLELMMRNELRLNTSLQSLVLGYWKLLRVGGVWQMSYHGGPCLSTKLPIAEYDVKVKMC